MSSKMTFDPTVEVDRIDISPLNVRKDVSEEKLDELVNSIREIGLQQPVVVYRKGQRYKLLIGQRRYLACKKLCMSEIPALIISIKDEADAVVKSFSENIHRLDLGYSDKMRVASRLLEKLGKVEDVAKALGVHPQTVRNYLGWAGVPEPLKKMAAKGRISATTAMSIARNVPDEKLAVGIAERVREAPSSARRKAIIEAAKLNPSSTPDQIVSLVERSAGATLTIDLTDRLAGALDNASKDYSLERQDIATEALEEWLTTRGFLQ